MPFEVRGSPDERRFLLWHTLLCFTLLYFTLLCWLCWLCCVVCDVSSFLFALRIPTYLPIMGKEGRRDGVPTYWNLEGGKDMKIRLSQSNLLPTIKIDNLFVLYNINLNDGYINQYKDQCST